MNLIISKHLFAAYCGMIKSGYSLTDLSDKDIKALYDKIQQIEFGTVISNYFSFAKTNTIEVNPYYPRGSDLSAACFFLDDDISKYIVFLNFCGSPSAHDREFIEWIKILKEQLKTIELNDEFNLLFAEYTQLINERFANINNRIYGFESKVKALYNCDIQFVFAPNLLQSKHLADFIFKNNILYVISTIFSPTAAAHEYFHIILGKKKWLIEQLINRINIDDFVDTALMIKFGYMSDRSLNSKINAMEDCIIRAICGIIADNENIDAYCKTNVECGFIGVPAMIDGLKENDINAASFDNIILSMAEIFGQN